MNPYFSDDSPTSNVMAPNTSLPLAPSPMHPVTPAPTQRRRRALGATALVAVAVAGGAVGSALTRTTPSAQPSRSTVAPVAVLPTSAKQSPVSIEGRPRTLASQSPAIADTGPLDVSGLVSRALPSVVDISVELNGGNGTGSGFVISSDGQIVTNAHVVADATKITVTFADKTKASGKVVGVDRTDDLAVVHVDKTGLPALELGSSADLRMGNPVVAIGSALALTGGPTATEGIISALGRTIDTSDGEHLAHLLQTDAAINPGNSGGPLLTLDGRVVGINSAGSTGAQNVGFAIAIDTAKPIVSRLALGQTITKGFLGVATRPVDADVASQNGLKVDHGLLVVDVTAASAAEKAGIAAGDVITEVDGTTIDAANTLSDAINAAGAGHTINLTINRAGKTLRVSAALSSHLA